MSHPLPDSSPACSADRDRLIEQMSDLPSLPAVIAQALQIMDSSEPSAESLAAAIETDHGFTATVLRIANSAFYGLAQEVYTVRDAIIIVGFEAVRSLAISAAVVSGVWVDDPVFSARRFWMHGLRCGLYAEALARKLRIVKPEIAFTLGVLHDIGRVVMIQANPDGYRKVMSLLETNPQYQWQAEREVFGFHHAEIGGLLALRWKLPLSYSEAIRHHHVPGDCPNHREWAHLLALADAISHHAHAEERDTNMVTPVYRLLWDPLGLDANSVREVMGCTQAIDERVQAFFAYVRVGGPGTAH